MHLVNASIAARSDGNNYIYILVLDLARIALGGITAYP